MVNSTMLSQITSSINNIVAIEARKNKIVEKTNQGIMVGEFTIVETKAGFDVIQNKQVQISFQNKIMAFEYAINYPRTKYKSTYLKSIDDALSRHKSDAAHHLSNIKYCRKQKNTTGVIHHENLLSECRYKINQCIRSAAKFSKYNF